MAKRFLKYKYLVFLGWISLLLAGCDPLVNYQFVLENNSQKNVNVEFFNGRQDTLIRVSSNDTALFFWDSQVNSEANDYYKEALWIFSKVSISQEGGNNINFDIQDRKRWNFRQLDKMKAEYRLAVEEEDFGTNE